MNSAPVVGIFREVLHSPERVLDDFEILRATGDILGKAGLAVELVEPELIASSSTWWQRPPPEMVFLMCEQAPMLERLRSWERRGTMCLNSIEGIENTYRSRMVAIMESARVPFPRSELIEAGTSRWNDCVSNGGSMLPLWVKRGDVHNTQAGDVALARSDGELRAVLLALESRGIKRAVLQEHIDGDLLKFYGVGQSEFVWSKWFYHKEQNLKGYPFDEDALRSALFKAAKALKLEVFGGDAVVTPEGSVVLIDINAWPSFALFRREASEAIARLILSKLAFVPVLQ